MITTFYMDNEAACQWLNLLESPETENDDMGW